MNTFLPTNNNRRSIWEEGAIPPLSLAQPTLTPETQFAWLHAGPKTKTAVVAQARPRHGWLKQACLVVWIALFSTVGYFLISRYVITAVEIQGRSMAPTLEEGHRYFLNRLTYLWSEPARGDLAVIHDPGHSDCAVKRIIGVPGDSIWIREGGVFVNDQRLVEPYLDAGLRTQSLKPQSKPLFLGPERYFLLGDNRANSEDSRNYGPIHRSQIVGLISK